MLLALVLLSGCASEKFDAYIGLWAKNNVDDVQVIRVFKDGDSYLIQDGVVGISVLGGGGPSVLRQSEGQLFFETPLGGSVLGLSEDGETLRVARMEFTRMTQEQIDEKVAERERVEIAQKADRAMCREIHSEYTNRYLDLQRKAASSVEFRAMRKALAEEFKDRARAIQNCNLRFSD